MKVLCFISNLFFPTIYADGFFDDYPKMQFSLFKNNTTTTSVINKANEVFGGWYYFLKWMWVFMLAFSLISFVLSIGRLAVHSSDSPFKKEGYKHDLMLSLILLAIMGGMPVIFLLILRILGGTF